MEVYEKESLIADLRERVKGWGAECWTTKGEESKAFAAGYYYALWDLIHDLEEDRKVSKCST